VLLLLLLPPLVAACWELAERSSSWPLRAALGAAAAASWCYLSLMIRCLSCSLGLHDVVVLFATDGASDGRGAGA
jgi:hypothetical protein